MPHTSAIMPEMSDPKRPGRPPLTSGDTPARVHLTVPSPDYDRAYQRAQRDGVSVPELLRRGLARLLDDEE